MYFFILFQDAADKDENNQLCLDNTCIYSEDKNRPRCLLFDYSENIRPYFQTNDKLPESLIEQLQSSLNGYDIYNYQQNSSKFVSFINKISDDDNEDNIVFQEESKEEHKYTIKDLLKYPDDKLYDFFDFEKNVKNWNDFLQPKMPSICLNEIKTIDIDVSLRDSYLIGRDFFKQMNFEYIYLEQFEDNFRKQMEDCDRLDLLHFSVDNNSFFGGISMSFIEQIQDMIPKTLKIYNAIDDISSFSVFNNEIETFYTNKFINYTMLLSQLNELEGNNVLFYPIYQKQTPSIIKNIFGYKYTGNKDDCAYKYYISSLIALQNQNILFPLRSVYYRKNDYLKNLMIHNGNLNIIQNDLVFKLEESHNSFPESHYSNGYFVNLSTNTNSPNFSWFNHFKENFPLKNSSSSIVYGYDQNNQNKEKEVKLMGENIDSFLCKISKSIFTSEKKFPLPICFPRRYYTGESNTFVNDMSVFCHLKPFINYPLRYLKEYKRWQKDFQMQIKATLLSIAKDKHFEFKEASENVFSLIYTYKDFAENVLNIFDESEDDDDD